MRLDEFYRGELGFRALLEYIDGLPSYSRLAAAMAEDEEAAEQLLAANGGQMPKPGPPPLTEYTPEVARLDNVVDRLGEVMGAVIGGAGGKPPKIKPAPRPVTALSRVRDRIADAHHNAVVELVAERRRIIAERRAANQEGG